MRWTEQRNFQACLHLLGTGGLDLGAITTRRVKFEDALPIYQTLGDGGSNDVGVVMEYGEPDDATGQTEAKPSGYT